MFSYVLSSASSYFHLPIEEDEDEDFPTASRHIAWSPSTDSTDSDDSDSGPLSIPSTSSTSFARSQLKTNRKEKAVIQEILSQNDLYHILGVKRTSRTDKMTLRRAYLTRSKACHPDKFPDNPEATRAFQKVSVAYDVLSKPSSRRLYDSQPPQSYDIFATRPTPPAQETFRGVIIGVFNDLLDGDLDMVRSLLSMNGQRPQPLTPIRRGGINSVLVSLQAIRERALTCRTCVLALHHELTHLLEVQRAFHDLSYFDIRRRSCLTIRLARLTVSLPIALERALSEQADDLYAADDTREGVGGTDKTALLNARVHRLLSGLVHVLERMEHVLK
ncbi:DnaJ-domain-containing protein [Fomitopsis serialis]|uniref:DnaJ-domain-containing protein n=1 Tax=Fomitopsis serialis TaxID=139415 RepID=UPI00200833B9|nr:DnaJ-domain-containing protein [Neoantrodia serialis]KAH9930152.1 DnaJ-domain-containing protein [Neoantrodia serialis]